MVYLLLYISYKGRMDIGSIVISGLIYDLMRSGVRDIIGELKRIIKISEHEDIFEDIQKNILNCEDITLENIESMISNDVDYLEAVDSVKYKTNFSRRINTVVEMINRFLPLEKRLNYENLGYYIGLSSSQEMLDYFYGNKIPDYDIEEKLALFLGVSVGWMKDGNGNCFDIIKHRSYREETEDAIVQGNPQKIYIVSYYHESDINNFEQLFVVNSYSEYCYRTINTNYSFINDLGAQGWSDLKCFVNFLNKSKDSKYILDDNIRLVEEETADAILSGKHPAISIFGRNCIIKKNFIDDLISINKTDKYDDYYENTHGKGFVEIGKRLRNMD